MSDYFGALLQSSGITIGTDASSRPLPTAPVPSDYGIKEVDEYKIITQPPASEHRIITESPASERMPMPLNPRQNMPDPAPREGAARASSLPESVQGNQSTANYTLIAQDEPNNPESKNTSPGGPALVQAALRWIAAGESPEQAAPEEPSSPTPQFASLDVSEDIRPHTMNEASAGKPAPFSYIQEDAVEISIGSIHVRVDAPPPPAAALTTPAPVTKPAAEPSPRSSLSRQALWRI
jgi:hypothetical protein